MLKPVAASNTKNRASWNQSMPKYHRYNGTAVSDRKNVPIRNELVVQLMRLIGMRKITRVNLAKIIGLLTSVGREQRPFLSRYERYRSARR